jgi:DNA-binding beta-propeller fold protein YncE
MSDAPLPDAPATHTPTPPPPLPPAPARNRTRLWMVAVVLALACGIALVARSPATGEGGAKEEKKPAPEVKAPKGPRLGETQDVRFTKAKAQDEQPKKKIPAPELEGGVAWLNSAGPVAIHESLNPFVKRQSLRGKVVLLDFWTLCCINCIHVMPDLAKLEKKYANELVVVGVHSPKFQNEKETASIRKAVLRYQIEHPVVNDADHAIWDRYEVDAWPTMVLIDPEGNLVGYVSGEGNFELLDVVIGKIVDEHKKKKTLDPTPIRFDLAKYREGGDTPLYFPGKVVADAKGKRLFIADSTHHRIVVTNLDGNKVAVVGTGEPGRADGAFDKAQFHDPQGMAVNGDTLYVADRKNHLIREVDLKAKTVTTIAGNGEQDHDLDSRRLMRSVVSTEIGLNSPWDVLLVGDTLFIAMAGHHQIWQLDLKSKLMAPYAGRGAETLRDGSLRAACFAQPSGLATDGKFLYVADSETSSLRKVSLDPEGKVETLVGRGLFVFGDRDGDGQDGGEDSTTEARMQHALGVAYHGGKLYVADTYNSKVKEFDLRTRKLTTLVSGRPFGIFGPSVFSEPGGISYANGKLYVADTNAHRIRVIDLATKDVRTLQLKGVEPPKSKEK